jgi:crossover junction endodeoxyribonuclease RuvC
MLQKKRWIRSSAGSLDELMFCGIDQSLTSTGIVVIQGNRVVAEEQIPFPEEPDYGHLDSMYRKFWELFDSKYTAYGFEGYAFAAKGNTLTRLVELGTMIRYAAYVAHTSPVYIFAPQNLKKFVAGKIFKKDETRLEVFKRWGYEAKSNDLVDAYAIARYTQAIYSYLRGENQELPSFQREAITAWAKKKTGIWT